jgi:hypothetical protein
MPTPSEIQALIARKKVKTDPDQAKFEALLAILDRFSPLSETEKSAHYRKFMISPDLAHFDALHDIAERVSDLKTKVITPKDGYTPVKGKDYVDGKDGKDGIDGKNGRDGIDGTHGQDAIFDEEKIIGKILKKIKVKDGKDAIIDTDSLKKEIIEEVVEISGKRKLTTADVEDLETRLNFLANKVEKNYGAHGGTTRTSAFTTSNNITFKLTTPLLVSELQVYLGGGRIFSQNGDFSFTTVTGNPSRVQTITLLGGNPTSYANGATLNLIGK